ncbi:hypothetical protein [Stenomitos frigidus]|uniref:Uncharacterized protein n=1 Tax=Stenomitos frigidus ULC18 TaxID=2107698 RepID=A0A2T1E7I7_9CYAN|nr:hypothetical protein [Stenomitos frigidus]PSB28712.1 hypothetical protein C7B82_12715 [Stenomitos frigidus ULC18]
MLTNAGFKLKPGQLERFPNPKPYSESPSLYAGHRLPLQAGSYLLNHDYQPIYGEQTTFVQRWQFAQHRNPIDQRTLKRVLQQTKRQRYKLSGKAEKFLHDLNTEVLAGWSDAGQTNYLLGRIAMREYIFGHVQRGGEPLAGADLAAAICEVARSLSGFEAYCHHQTDLEPRAMFYARSIQSSRYYPFGSKHQAKASPLPERLEPPKPNWNQEQSQAARDRIQTALSDLQQRQTLPATITARRHAIRTYGIGNQTLDKYKELWHPNHLKPLSDKEYNPIQSLAIQAETLELRQGGEYHPIDTNKLMPIAAAPQGQAAGSLEVGLGWGLSTGAPAAAADQKSERAEKQLVKMQVWLESEDPILVAEAQQFFTVQAQKDEVSLGSTDGVTLEQREGCANEEAGMPGGFGRSHPQRRGGKSALQEIRQLSVVSQ